MNIIEKALQISSKAHINQCRKHTDIPYITHPVAVGMILIKAGYGDDIVAAGIQHDTVEDTSLSMTDIVKHGDGSCASFFRIEMLEFCLNRDCCGGCTRNL